MVSDTLQIASFEDYIHVDICGAIENEYEIGRPVKAVVDEEL